MDHLLQLHEHIEIHYYVDRYEAQLWTTDGGKLTVVGQGQTIDEAMEDLKRKSSWYNLEEIRAWSPMNERN